MQYIPGNPETLEKRLNGLARILCRDLPEATKMADERGGFCGCEDLRYEGKDYIIHLKMEPLAR